MSPHRPDKSVDITRRIVKEHFKSTPDGLPGNDDAGAMSAWLVFNLLGYYPVAGQDVYLITAPFFRSTVVHSVDDKGDKRSFKVLAYGLSSKNRYVSSARLNGKPIRRSWFRHTEIWMEGKDEAVLELWLKDKPGMFGTRDEDLPPSRPV